MASDTEWHTIITTSFTSARTRIGGYPESWTSHGLVENVLNDCDAAIDALKIHSPVNEGSYSETRDRIKEACEKLVDAERRADAELINRCRQAALKAVEALEGEIMRSAEVSRRPPSEVTDT